MNNKLTSGGAAPESRGEELTVADQVDRGSSPRKLPWASDEDVQAIQNEIEAEREKYA